MHAAGHTARLSRIMIDPPLNIVLLHPEIPNNTGNIGRTVAATKARLHLVHPLGFDLSEKACRRAGLDYWHLLDCRQHESWEAFLEYADPPRMWLYTTKATRPHWEARFEPGDYLLFGRETSGVPDDVQHWFIERYGEDHRVTLPMDPAARSLNLASVVCTAVYEAVRQISVRATLP